MVFQKFVELGRVVFIANGKGEGKLGAIVNVVDQNRVCIFLQKIIFEINYFLFITAARRRPRDRPASSEREGHQAHQAGTRERDAQPALLGAHQKVEVRRRRRQVGRLDVGQEDCRTEESKLPEIKVHLILKSQINAESRDDRFRPLQADEGQAAAQQNSTRRREQAEEGRRQIRRRQEDRQEVNDPPNMINIRSVIHSCC